MKSRPFSAACLIVLMYGLCAATVAKSADGPAQPETEATAEVNVHPGRQGRAIPQDFLGFSYEAPVLAQDYFDADNEALANLLSNLGTGVLRFGGNSVEFTYWSRNGKISAPKARAILTPQDLDRLFAFSSKTGWRVILGLNLGHYDPQMAADEAAYAVARGGSHLLAIEIGNEPDLFMHNGQRPATWGYRDFRREFEAYVQAIRSRSPDAPISGPTACCKAGLEWFPQFLADEGSQLVMANFHNYPMSASQALSPNSPRYPTIERMLSSELMDGVAKEIRQLADEAQVHHLPLRMAEVNSASSGGKNGVSNVFAAALWGADYAFTLAEQGAAGLNFHGGFRCEGYTPVCISHGTYSAQPLYYGMLLFHAATPGRLVLVRVRSKANVSAYGVLAKDGMLHLALINKDVRQSVRVRISGAGSYSQARVLRLIAPSLGSQTGITFGGSPVGPTGDWSPTSAEKIERRGRAFLVQLPAASAAVVNLHK